MSNPFTETRPPVHRLILAAYFFTATMALACGPRAAIAADMPVKAPEAPAYQWSGCYLGVNLGGGTSGTNFGSTVDPGTYLAAGDAATVGGSGGGGANADGILAGGQAGCNLQSGTLVYGLEGDFDYFHSNPQFNNNTNTLADGNTFAVWQSLTTNFLATVRPRIGIAADRNFAYITGGAAFTSISYTESYATRTLRPAAGTASASKITRGLDRRGRLGICLRRPLDGPSRISIRELPDDECAWDDHRTRRRSQYAPRFRGSRDPARSRRRELQVLIAASASCSNPPRFDLHRPPARAPSSGCGAARKSNGDTMSTTIETTQSPRAPPSDADASSRR